MSMLEMDSTTLDGHDSNLSHLPARHSRGSGHAGHDDEHEEHPHEEGESWLMSFADLVLNLLMFFIVLYSISSVDEDKLMELARQINGEIVPQTVVKKADSEEENTEVLQEIQTLMQKFNQDVSSDAQKKEAEKVETKIAELFRTLPGKDKENDLFEVVLSGSKYFVSGQPFLTEAAKEAIRAFSLRLKPISKEIGLYIEGHAAPAELVAGQADGYEWELASQRASLVLLEIKKTGIQIKNVSTSGFGAEIDLSQSGVRSDVSETATNRSVTKQSSRFSRARVHLRVVREVKSQ